MASDLRTRFTLRLTNREDAERTVILEPWTGEYRLPGRGQLDVAVEGSAATPLEIELVGDRIVIYAFDSTDASLVAYRDGQELRSEHQPDD
jgi:hypothetical protein